MYSFEAQRIQSAVSALHNAMSGSTPDRRMDAIVASIEAISKWIEKFEREISSPSA
jgi:hypothetical protein